MLNRSNIDDDDDVLVDNNDNDDNDDNVDDIHVSIQYTTTTIYSWAELVFH